MKKRLELILKWIENTDNLLTAIADIGTDHGTIPFYLASKYPQMQLFATDIVSLPIENLRTKTKTMPNIKTFVGFGLNPLQNQELDLCIIAGMGVAKILKILKLDSHLQKNYIFQGIENPIELRKWAQNRGYFLKKEMIIKEKKYYYHSLWISKKEGVSIDNEKECFFGPILLRKKNSIFIEYWKNTLNFKKQVINAITQTNKRNRIKQEISAIESVV